VTLILKLLPALLTLALFFPGGAGADEGVAAQTPIIKSNSRFVPIVARNGMVVGPEQLAAEVGRDILDKGGNAVDAAVATGFALAVTYPRAGNLGGGGFMMIHLAKENRQTFIDYRETAPGKARRDMFLDENGEIDRNRIAFTHLAAGVPGSVAGMLYALEKYGTMSRKEVLAPAIELAQDGIAVSYAHSSGLTSREERLNKNPEAARLLLRKDGTAYEVGEKWRQKDLAKTLKEISKNGRDGFYRGKVAKLIAEDMAANGGLISEEDLAGYQVVERTPLRTRYKEYEVVAAPPPSSGGVLIIQMLNILSGFDLPAMGHNSATYLHYLVETMKLSYADRSKFLGDPAYFNVPVAALTDPNYAARQRAMIDPARATPSTEILPGEVMTPESRDTTHYSVADSQGNVVSNTYTLNFSFGSHIAVPGTGMLLNNEMADFAASVGTADAYGLVEGEANLVAPGKRPLSSMSPTLVFRDGKPWMATGSPGGSLIISTVVQILVNSMAFDMNMAEAAAMPRVHHQWQPDQMRVERGISPDTLLLLEEKGHPVKFTDWSLGRTQSIRMEDGWFFGASDTRRSGGWVAGY
jgi:gamma-glutamyltranspeptidase/glutathione hydrolase